MTKIQPKQHTQQLLLIKTVILSIMFRQDFGNTDLVKKILVESLCSFMKLWTMRGKNNNNCSLHKSIFLAKVKDVSHPYLWLWQKKVFISQNDFVPGACQRAVCHIIRRLFYGISVVTAFSFQVGRAAHFLFKCSSSLNLLDLATALKMKLLVGYSLNPG